ncbi:MAG: outer membrane beta-barrel protein [Lewinellaceae bacterium]|nr:outer membrane beta-barrel protein [Lewinellaceae bacterium]
MLKPVLFFSLLIAVLSLRGQDGALSFAAHAGATLATIKPEWDAFDPKLRTGFFVGANVRWAISERWGLPIDVQFSQRGFYFNSPGALIVKDNQVAIYQGRIDFRTGNLDVIPQIEFCPIKQIGIAAGPYLSTRLSESVRYGDVVDWTSTKDDKVFEGIDFGLTAKLSGNLGPVTLFVSYWYGLVDMVNIQLVDENGQSLGILAAKSRAVLVGAGWRF